MKKLMALAIAASLLVGFSAHAGDIEVTWDKPEKFRDFKPGNNIGKKRFIERSKTRFDEFFAEFAQKLPENYKLKVTVKDVDLAGDSRPWHNGDWIRVIKAPYSPMMKFDYQLIDQSGAVLKSAEDEKIRDMAFDMHLAAVKMEREFYYEKKMLKDWFNDAFSDYLKPSK